jgi:hypothetical protein
MKNSASLRILLLACVSVFFAPILRAESATPLDVPNTCYLFAYFVGQADGLHLAWSKDGFKWAAFMDGDKEKIFLKPEAGHDKLMRDPCILLGPDRVFRLVWTDSNADRNIGYAGSSDLLHWSEQQTLPVMSHEPKALNAWAPEVHYDAVSGKYLIFWSTAIPGRFPETDNTGNDGYNHRTYLITTTDFVNYTPTTLWFNPGFDEIDSTLIPFEGRYYLIFKNETQSPVPAKNLYLATSNSMLGPYTHVTGPIATRPAHWIEGPTAIQIGNRVVIYYDCYMEGHFGACETTDMESWQDDTPLLSMPKGMRHGTVVAVPGSVVSNLLNTPGITADNP